MFVDVDYGALRQSDVIIVAPTGSGKTTWALGIAKHLDELGYKRLVILEPTRALMFQVFEASKRMGYSVGIDNSDASLLRMPEYVTAWRRKVVVTSYEKFDSIAYVNRDVVNGSIIVFDEIHNMFGERGLAIQNIISTARLLRRRGGKVRLVFMSATVPNINLLKKCTGAKVYEYSERPVPLDVKIITLNRETPRGSSSYIFFKFNEIYSTVSSAPKPVLVYVPSRRLCEYLAREFNMGGLKAVAWHAGIKYALRKKLLREMASPNPPYDVVVATDVISQGVNLKFNSVVIPMLRRFTPTGPVAVEKFILRQVAGRAGRPGSERGYVYVIAFSDEEDYAKEAFAGDLSALVDLRDDATLVARLVLTGRDVETWLDCACLEPSYILDLKNALRALRVTGTVRDEGGRLVLDETARAVVGNYLPVYVTPLFKRFISSGKASIYGMAARHFMVGYALQPSVINNVVMKGFEEVDLYPGEREVLERFSHEWARAAELAADVLSDLGVELLVPRGRHIDTDILRRTDISLLLAWDAHTPNFFESLRKVSHVWRDIDCGDGEACTYHVVLGTLWRRIRYLTSFTDDYDHARKAFVTVLEALNEVVPRAGRDQNRIAERVRSSVKLLELIYKTRRPPISAMTRAYAKYLVSGEPFWEGVEAAGGGEAATA